jgi:hypothetical protein
MRNLPLHADYATSKNIHRRAELALRAELQQVIFTFRELDPEQAWQEMLRGVYYLVHRELGGPMPSMAPELQSCPTCEADEFNCAEGTPAQLHSDGEAP